MFFFVMYKQNTFTKSVSNCQVFGFMIALQIINWSLTKCRLEELRVISDTLQRHSKDKAAHK